VESDNNTSHHLYLQNGSKQPASGARVLVVGEILWDQFANELRLGGAPLNFAVHLSRLRHLPLLLSGVGVDARGIEARRAIQELGLDARLVQSTGFNTGIALVHGETAGHESFTIERPAAYDAIELSAALIGGLVTWNPAWLYYGTLFSACSRPRAVLRELLESLPDASRFYDVNVRPGFDRPDLVADLLQSADVVKLNEEELQFVHDFLGLPSEPEDFCRVGCDRYGWRAVCVTLGDRGCAMRVAGDYVEAEGYRVDVADTVGAGDAFAAAFLHGLIAEWPVAKIAEFANRVGAFVASVHGAIPDQIPDAVFDT